MSLTTYKRITVRNSSLYYKELSKVLFSSMFIGSDLGSGLGKVFDVASG